MESQGPLRAALYARISEDDNSVDKTGNQLAACLKLADGEGYEVVAELDEGPLSAYQGLERPRFKELAQLVQSGAVDVVVATEQTRLAREDHERAAFAKISADRGVLWHFSTSGAVLDLSKPTDRLNAGITGLFASYESDLKKMRLNARFDAQRILGLPLWGPRPFGYEKDRVTVRKSEAKVLEEAYAAVLEGTTLTKIVRKWEADGIRSPIAEDSNPKRPVRRKGGNLYNVTTLKALLLRPRNVAVRTSGEGETFTRSKAAWPQIIDCRSFLKVRKILRDPTRSVTPSRVKRYLSAGLVLCDCGLPLRSGNGNGEVYLRCRPSYERRGDEATSKKHSSIRMDIAEPYVYEALVSAICDAPPPESDEGSSTRTGAIQAEISSARGRIEELLDMFDNSTTARGQIQPRIAKQEAIIVKLQAEQVELDRVQQGRLRDLRTDMFARDPDSGNMRVSLDAGVTLRTAVRARLAELTVAEQTEYAREYIEVRVAPGRRPALERLSVRFPKTPHLNDGADDAAEAAYWEWIEHEERREQEDLASHSRDIEK